MCIKYIRKYTQCNHTGFVFDRCEIYHANPKDPRHKPEKRPETINGLCGKCGGGPKKEPTVAYIPLKEISSLARESVTGIESPSSLDSGVELLRKGSQKAMGGMKRFIGSIRSNRSSGGSSGLLDAVSETESPSVGESAEPYSSTSEPLAENQRVDASISPARPWRRVTGNSSGLIHLNSNSNMNGILPKRPSLGRDIETASVVTTWTKVISHANGDPEPREALPQPDRVLYQKRAEFSQVSRPMEQRRLEELAGADGGLYQQRIEASPGSVVTHQRRLEEFARADERLARVRDVRGFIKCNVI
jgi:hypothetical protein